MEEVAEVVSARQTIISLKLGSKRPKSWLQQLFAPSPVFVASSRGKSVLLVFLLASFFFYLWRRKRNKQIRERERQQRELKDKDREDGLPKWDYELLKDLVKNEKLPAMIVEHNIMNRNIRHMGSVAAAHGKTIRLATKSIRVPAIIEHVLEEGKGVYKGLMCFAVDEAYFLAQQIPGARDFLIAYPTVQPAELEVAWDMVVSKDCKVVLMVDSLAHVQLLDDFWSRKCKKFTGDAPSDVPKCSVCIDVDMSYRPFGNLLHLGVHRSPLRTLDAVKEVVEAIQASKSVRLSGVMGYEAQIAGLPDNNPHNNPVMRAIIQTIKYFSSLDVPKRRKEINDYLTSEGIKIDFFNGGGTGSLEASCNEEWLTEVTIGSGVLQSTLFDYYLENHNLPAFCFGLRVTRIAEPRVVVCQSGGFVASGDAATQSLPCVFLPEGLAPFANEGFGEVQTPLVVPKQLWASSSRPALGDPVFLRPAKAGEIAERFTEYCIIDLKENTIVQRVKTYRGHGMTFY